MALSQVVDVEVNPADIAGVCIWYMLGSAEFSIALSALYQLLLFNPQQECAMLSGLRDCGRSRQLTDTWAANKPYYASLWKLQWEGCAGKEILLSSRGLNPPARAAPAAPREQSPPPSPEKPKPLPPPPKSTQHKKTPPPKRKSFKSGNSSSSDQALPVDMGRRRGSSRSSKSGARSPPLWRGMRYLTPCLVNR